MKRGYAELEIYTPGQGAMEGRPGTGSPRRHRYFPMLEIGKWAGPLLDTQCSSAAFLHYRTTAISLSRPFLPAIKSIAFLSHWFRV